MTEENGNLELLHIIWEWAKKVLTAEDWNNKLLLNKDVKERTACHRAAEKGKLKELLKLREWVKEMLTAEGLNNKLLLAKADREYIALQSSSINVQFTGILGTLWMGYSETEFRRVI